MTKNIFLLAGAILGTVTLSGCAWRTPMQYASSLPHSNTIQSNATQCSQSWCYGSSNGTTCLYNGNRCCTSWSSACNTGAALGCPMMRQNGNQQTTCMNNPDRSQWWNHIMAMMPRISSELNFIVNMIPHHQEAVDSATIMLSKTSNAGIKALSQWIIDAQNKEISMMKWRLASWYPKNTETPSYMKMMPNLSSISWKEADVAFLQGMISHHQWAIEMAEAVLREDHRAEVRSLAADIIATQSKEIATMQTMLQSQ